MSGSVDVVYTLRTSEGAVLHDRQVMLLKPWAGQAANALAVAQEICEEVFDENLWAEMFFDSSRERVEIEIHAPAEVAGRYAVEMAMRPKATARRLP